MKSIKYLSITFLLISTFGAGVAQADLNESMGKMCEKIKTCGKAELDKQELSKEMKDMMSAMFDGMCQSMFAPHMMTLGQAGLERKAEACMDSMGDASCDELMSDGEQFSSQECRDFEQAAESAGLSN